jgi:ACS family hexuronate transporter-like MFS transporter
MSQSNYRWYILSLGVITHVIVFALPRICISVLLPEISADLNLTLVEMGMIWGICNLPVVFFSLFGGMLGDRYGPAKVLTFSCILQGVLSALRGFSGDYTTLLSFSFLFGIAGVAVPYMTHKAAGQWFSGRQLGVANGILAMGMGFGYALGAMISATVMSPLLGGWRNIMFVYGALAVIIGIIWIKTRKAPLQEGASPSEDTIPLRQSMSHVIRLWPVWLLAFGQMFLNSGRNGVVGYVPTYLTDIGWPVASASGAVTILSLASVVGAIPISWISDKIGLRKSVFISGMMVAAIGYGLLSVITNAAIWPLVIIAGLVQEANAAFFFTMVMETKGVGRKYSGTALGLLATFGGLGSFFGPPLGNSLAVYSPAYAFICWAFLAVLAIAVVSFVKETGWKKDELAREIEITYSS